MTFEWQGIPVFAGRTGYTGEDGFELIVPAEAGEALWEQLIAAGATPCGLGARDVLRVEAGLHLYGHELTEQTNPIEAGLGWLVSERTDYIGAEIIQRIKAEGPRRKLMGIMLQERGVPREGYPVLIAGTAGGAVDQCGLFSHLGARHRHGVPARWSMPNRADPARWRLGANRYPLLSPVGDFSKPQPKPIAPSYPVSSWHHVLRTQSRPCCCTHSCNCLDSASSGL
jgi:hypothetical protein